MTRCAALQFGAGQAAMAASATRRSFSRDAPSRASVDIPWMTAITCADRASASVAAGSSPASIPVTIRFLSRVSMDSRMAASSRCTSIAAAEQLIAELASRQPAGVSAPVNPMADAVSRIDAAYRAEFASTIIVSEALIGVSRTQQVLENIAALDLALSSEHRAAFDKISQGEHRMLYSLFTPALRRHLVFGWSSVRAG